MKIESNIFIVLLLMPILSISQEEEEEDYKHHCLFEHKSLTLGVASPYSFEVNIPGINLRMYYNINENICFGPEVSYFKNGETEVIDFDFVGHYIFETPIVGIYPLLGANYTVEKEEPKTETIAKVGMIYGLGIHRNVKSFTFFAEYSRIAWGVSDQFITSGVMYNLN